MKKFIPLLLSFNIIIFSLFANATDAYAQNALDDYIIKENCIGQVCIGDTLEKIKDKYTDYIITPNDEETGYYIFDTTGNFLIEFSTKKSIDNKNAPVRYIMTSNENFKYATGNIKLETKISELIPEYGQPIYEAGPNGYVVNFKNWPIKEHFNCDKYKVNTIVGVYNPNLAEMFKFNGIMNEDAEIKMLKQYPDKTILNSIEIYSDYYKDGKAME